MSQREDYKGRLEGHLEDTPVQILSCPSKSIFSVAEVRQEKIDPEGELQVEERQRGFNINSGCRSK